MTSNNLHNRIKTRILLALIIMALICTSLFCFTACSTPEETKKPTYSYTDVNDGLISNPTFFVGTADTASKSFPLTSTTGWSRSKDGTGSSSSAKSGVIDVSEDGWKNALTGLYSDSYYLEYLMSEHDFSKQDAKNEIIKEKNDSSYKPTNDEIKQYVVENYMLPNVANPGVKAGATDNKVYMLNNYNSNIGWGASQKITSDSEITLKKGESAKITVSLFTQNLKGLNDEFGASIRIIPKYNNIEQADFVLANIVTNGWETFQLYVSGDAEKDTSFKLALGLGFNIEYQTQGTVYFDDIIVEKVDSVPTDNKLEKTFTYSSNEDIVIEQKDAVNKNIVFSIDLDDSSNNKSFTPDFADGFTKSNNGDITSQSKFGNKSTASFDGQTVTLENASYTLTVSSSDNFKIAPEQYVYVSFLLNNNLNKLGNTSITIDIIETTNDLNKKYAEAAIINTIDEANDFTRYGLVIKNNFDDEKFAGEDRTFNLSIVIGPTKISSTDKLSDYATGSVTIKDFKIATGATYQYDNNNVENENYSFYEMYCDQALSVTPIYAGFNSDYAATEEDASLNGFEVSAIDLAYIKERPVVPKDYDGVIPNHIYLKNDDTASKKVNERSTTNGVDGSFAGVVNRKTELSVIKDVLTANINEDEQSLMIYNKTADNYGYISMNGTKTVSPKTYAKISIQVKVLDNAKAYIYLVDTASKQVMSFVDFTPNTNGLTSIKEEDRTALKASDNLFEIVVDKNDMENAVDGWLTVEFYIAAGNESKNFRIELWNGDRTGDNKSEGYVFFKNVNVDLSASNFEPASFTDSFIGNSNPLAIAGKNSFDNYFCYIRELTDIEKEFNKDYPNQAISYSSKIVWAKNDTMVYAIFNNLEYLETDPYATIEEEEEEETGCAAETNPSTFWLSFSSILLAVVLLAAIIVLFVRNIRRRRKATASDAKSHYTVKSRVNYSKKNKQLEAEETIEEVSDEEQVEETAEVEEQVETQETEADETPTEEQTEQPSDEYVYGEVQDFGENKENN